MSRATLPPGPRSALPVLLHLRDPFPLMDAWVLRHASPMTCPLVGQPPMVLVWDPEGLKTVLGQPPETYGVSTPEALLTIVGRGSIFAMAGDRHRRARKLLMPPFHGERMKAYAGVIQSAARVWLSRRELGRSGPILPLAQGITLDVILEAVFGEREPEHVARLHAQILGVVTAFNPLVASVRALQRDFGGVGPWARLQRRTTALRASIDALITQREDRPGPDILSLLLATRDEDGQPMARDEIYEQLMTFVVAGHETTATTLAWALYELHRHPETLRTALDELAGAHASAERLATLPFLGAVVEETLRRHPPVPIVPRRLARELALGPFTLPPGQSLGLAVYMAHHDPQTYAEPFTFRPERFLEDHPAGLGPSALSFLPFGGGARRCLGAAFAMVELRVALGTLLSEATFTLDEHRPVGSAYRIGTFGPSTGVRMTVSGRRTSLVPDIPFISVDTQPPGR